MATQFNVSHVGNIGTLAVRYEDLQTVEGKDGKKVKKWVPVPSRADVKPHSSLDIWVGPNRRVVIEEQPT
jgi:hypothetical protein